MCYSRVNGNPELYQICLNYFWIPAFAGMTRRRLLVFQRSQLMFINKQITTTRMTTKKKKGKKISDKKSKSVKKTSRLLNRLSSKPVLFLTIIIFIVYINVLWNGFTYDDKSILGSELIHNPKNVKALFNKEYFKNSGEQSYRPIVTLSYMLEYPLWKTNSTGYHLNNLLLHIFVVLIFYKILTMFIDKWASFMGALIYGIHPLTTEVVNSIGFREDSLCALFLLLSILFYLYFSFRNKSFYIVVSIIFYCFSLFSKEMAITLPLLIIILDFSFNGLGIVKKRILAYSVYFLLTIFYLFLRFKIMYEVPEEKVGYYGGSLATALISVPKLILTYVQLIIFPHPLSADRYINLVKTIFNLYFWIGLLLIVILLITLTKLKRGYRFGLLWFFITLLPVLNFIPIYNPFAERYMYIPLMGVAIIIAFLLNEYRYNKIVWAAFVYALIGLSIRTHYRNYVWKDDISLFSNAIKYPCRPRAYYNLGVAYYESREYEKAIDSYQKAIALKPDYYEAYDNLGLIYNSLNKIDEAIALFKKSLIINPKNENAYINLSVSLKLKGDFTGSIDASQKAIEINPQSTEAYINLGKTYMTIKNFDEATKNFRKAIDLNPNSFEGWASLGNLYFTTMNYDKAIENYQEALKINPASALVQTNIGLSYEKTDRYDQAIKHYEQAILFDGNYVNAYNNLAWLYTTSKDKDYFMPDRAIKLAKRACELTNYKDAETLDTLAEAYSASGDYDKAIEYELEARAFATDDKKEKFEKRLEIFRGKKEGNL